MEWGRFKKWCSAFAECIEPVFSAIMPETEQARHARATTLQGLHVTPALHDLYDSRIVTLLNYKDRATRDVVRSLKYDASGHAARLCAEVLADYLAEELASLRTFSTKKIVLVPIPLHKARIRKRGFNQIERVLRALPREYREGTISTVSPLLIRTRDTPHQTHLHRNERLKNVTRAFALVHPTSLLHTHVFLIDDVMTTGSTLIQASLPLRETGATVTLIALAHA